MLTKLLREKELLHLLRSASPLLVANVLNAIISSGLIIMVARYLDPSTYGRYAIILGVVQSAMGLASSGVGTWGAREVARSPESTNDVFASLFKFLMLVATIFLAVTVSALVGLSMPLTITLAAVVLTVQVVVRSLTDAANGILLGRSLTPIVARANIFESTFSLLLIPIALFFGGGLVGLALAELFATSVRAAISFRGLSRVFSWDHLRKGNIQWAVRSSRSFWITQSSFSLASRLQPVVIGVSSSSLAGLYAFGQRIFESSVFAISPLSTVLMPHVTKSIQDRTQVRRTFITMCSLAALAGVGMGAAIEGASRWVLPRLVGGRYSSVFGHLWILGICVVFLFVAQILYAYLIALGTEKFLARSSAVSSLVFLGFLSLIARTDSLGLLFGALLAWYVAVDAVWLVRVSLELSSHGVVQRSDVAARADDRVSNNLGDARAFRPAKRRLRSVRKPFTDWMTRSLPLIGSMCILAAAISIGWMSVSNSMVVFIPASVIAGLLIVRSAEARLVFVVFGGLLLLQSSGGLNPLKLAYLAGCTLAIGVIISQRGVGMLVNELSPLWLVSVPWLIASIASFPISHTSGVSFQGWARDIIPYLLFACQPIFASDLLHLRRTTFVAPFSIAVGALAVLSTSIQWTQNRGFVSLPIGRFLLSSYMLSIVALSLALAFARYGSRNRTAWALFAGVCLFLLFLTGTRSSIVVLAAPIVVFTIGPDRGIRRLTRGFGTLAGLSALFVSVYVVAVAALHIKTGELLNRYGSILDVTNTKTSAGQSYGLRLSQTDAARRAFQSNPLFGVGPGYQFTALNSLGKLAYTANLDSPLAIAAKFGILGVAAAALSFAGYWLFLRRMERERQTCSGVALRATLVTLLLTCLIYSPFEDKGLSFGLMMMTTLVAARYGTVEAPVLEKRPWHGPSRAPSWPKQGSNDRTNVRDGGRRTISSPL